MLRAHFAEHNRRVLLLATITLFVAAGLWYVSYAVLFWLTLLAMSATRGIEARPPETLPALFIYSGALLLLITWGARRYSPYDMARDDKTAVEIAADFLLAVPRATLAIWGNLSAYRRLSDLELEYAAVLVDRVARETRLPLSALPQEIPDRTMRGRILLALQLVQFLEVGHRGGSFFVSLTHAAARALPQ